MQNPALFSDVAWRTPESSIAGFRAVGRMAVWAYKKAAAAIFSTHTHHQQQHSPITIMQNVKVLSALCLLVLGALALGAQAAEYRFIGRQSTPGSDLSCGQTDSDGKPQPFCKLCTGVAGLADSCDSNPECQGFDLEGSSCGYLKAAAGVGKTQYMEGFSHYCKVGSGAQCAGSFLYKRRANILGNDVDCNAKSYKGEKLFFCSVSGSATEVAAACAENPNCKAFSTSGYGGNLKSAGAPTTYAEGYATYVKA